MRVARAGKYEKIAGRARESERFKKNTGEQANYN